MGTNKPANRNAEILHRINRFTSDADWSNIELRAELINQGVNPDTLLSGVKRTISNYLSPAAESLPKNNSFKGILAQAKELGISNFQLAELTDLSVVLIAQFDRGLIKVNEKLPHEIIERIADAVNTTTEQIINYLQPGPRFAEGASYKAEDTPSLPESIDFPDAVIQDPTLPDPKRDKLLAMSKGAS